MKKLLIVMLLGVSVLTVGCGKKDIESKVETSDDTKAYVNDLDEKELAVGNAKPDNYYQENEVNTMDETISVEEQLYYLEQQVQNLMSENVTLTSQVTELKNIEEEYEIVKNENFKLENEKKSLEDKLTEKESSCQLYIDRYNNSLAEIRTYKEEISALDQKLTRASETISDLEFELSQYKK